MTECFIFDIDGTLADPRHRLHYIQQEPKDWDGFFEACDKDTRIGHVWITALALSDHYPIVIVSGRSDQVREKTEKWLKNNFLPWDALYMRKAGDHRPDTVVKKELLAQLRADGWEPRMVFDDRDSVVKMWREQGVPCAQVAEGNF